MSADDTAAEMVDLLCQQLKPKAGDKMMLIINGVGATTHMELNIIFRKAYKELEARGLQVVVSLHPGNSDRTGTGRFPDDHGHPRRRSYRLSEKQTC